MPSVTVHLRLAERALDRWRSRPRDSPFDPFSDVLVNAFFVGAMAPDMGFMPGGFRPLSDLAHALRSGTLSRGLLSAARTPLQRAFAWGWVTHVLADSLVHPIIGCAVGELVTGSPGRFIDGDRDTLSHVRVEVGLDAVYAERHPEYGELDLRPIGREAEVGFVRRAYRATYGVAPDRTRLAGSLFRVPRRMLQGLALAALSSRLMPPHRETTGEDPGLLLRLRSLVGRSSVPAAFLLPAPPRLWLIDAVRDVEWMFADAVTEAVDSRGGCLQDLNLDTGGPDLEEVGYGGLHRAVAYIQAQGGPSPALPGAVAQGA